MLNVTLHQLIIDKAYPIYIDINNDKILFYLWVHRANIFRGSTPEKFEQYFEKQFLIAKEINSHSLFINAWNERAEGAHLEPDELNQYGYLKAVEKVIKEDREWKR